MIQEYIKGFDKSNPEIRTYFINGEYFYSIITTVDRVGIPVQEGGTFKLPDDKFKYAIELAKRVMDSLPKFDLSNKSSILTRIDIGSGLEGVPFNLFINEVEFVPSLYIEDQPNPVVEKIGESLFDVAKEYHSRKAELPIKIKF